MEFKEFEKLLEDKDDSINYYEMYIDGLCLDCCRGDDGLFYVSTYYEKDDSYGEIITHNEVTVGKYNTLKGAYKALKEICKLNNVEME